MPKKLPRLDVGRYEHDVGYVGWIEPEDKKWIVFVAANRVEVYNREPKTGSTIGEPAMLEF